MVRRGNRLSHVVQPQTRQPWRGSVSTKQLATLFLEARPLGSTGDRAIPGLVWYGLDIGIVLGSTPETDPHG